MISLCITFAYGPYIIHLRSRCEFMLSLPIFCGKYKIYLILVFRKKMHGKEI